MKQILIALAMMGMTLSGAEAQSGVPTKCTCKAKRVAAHRMVHHRALPLIKQERTTTSFVKNYQVCREDDGYYTCCLYKKTTTANR